MSDRKAMLHELQRDGAAQQRPRRRCGSESIKQPRTRPGGATHVLRDGDEADADERQGAAGVAAGPGEGRQSDPSRGSEARHAHPWPHARAPKTMHKRGACCSRELESARAHTAHASDKAPGNSHVNQIIVDRPCLAFRKTA